VVADDGIWRPDGRPGSCELVAAAAAAATAQHLGMLMFLHLLQKNVEWNAGRDDVGESSTTTTTTESTTHLSSPPKIFGPAQNKRQVIRHDNPQQLSILLIVRFTGKGEPEQKRFRSEMVNRERERNKKEILNAIETGWTHTKKGRRRIESKGEK
jgi:hypothetical protein